MARPRKSQNETYTRYIGIRAREDELAQIEHYAQTAGLPRAEYIRRMALKGKIKLIERPGVFNDEEFAEIKRQGNNLNQIAMLAHSTGRIPLRLQRILDIYDYYLSKTLEVI